MLRTITSTIRHIKRRTEAARRQMKAHDQMAYQGGTWNTQQWGRAIRYESRLDRIASGGSPWRHHNRY